MILTTRRHTLALAAPAALLLPSASRGQGQAAWPTAPVTFVVGYAPGGGTDIAARALVQLLSPVLGQPIVVDNKGGASGSVAARAVASAKPDGYTLFYAADTNIVVNPHVQKGSIDPLAALAPICQTTDFQNVLVVNPRIPATTAAELVALAKKQPGTLTYASSGVAGASHRSGALFAEASQIEITHVPYKGTAPALADVISGQITMIFSSTPPAVSQIKAGTLRALAVTGAHRVAELPEVPTLKEQGIDVVFSGWQGLFAPARTTDGILDKVERDAKAAMTDAAWRQALAKDGLEPAPDRSRAGFAAFVREEHTFWGRKLTALGIEKE